MIDFLAKIGLDKLDRALAYGVALALALALLTNSFQPDYPWATFFVRWLHVLSGVMWIGLLWYFNFVQIPSMPKIPDEQKPAVSKVIARDPRHGPAARHDERLLHGRDHADRHWSRQADRHRHVARHHHGL
jgi:hypothetical protein